jgi:hypothetical protein
MFTSSLREIKLRDQLNLTPFPMMPPQIPS